MSLQVVSIFFYSPTTATMASQKPTANSQILERLTALPVGARLEAAAPDAAH
jgi:hypothetical protein